MRAQLKRPIAAISTAAVIAIAVECNKYSVCCRTESGHVRSPAYGGRPSRSERGMAGAQLGELGSGRSRGES